MFRKINLSLFAFSSNSYKFRCVFLRHGESQYNKENRFCGWHDALLSETGIQEAKNAGRQLKQAGFQFDVAYTSVLTRAIQTYNLAAEELGSQWLPVNRSWRLNERHYGGLTGLNKSETAEKHGEAQVKIWRRSYDIPPPAFAPNDPKNPINDRRYHGIPKDALPATECLKDTVARVIPFWHDHIANDILDSKQVIVVAHGNSIRAIVKYLDNISEKEILELNIPTSVPLVYEFDAELKPLRNYYLGDQEEIKRKMEAVAKQGSAKK